MIRAFLFDIGNVLVRFDFSKAYQAIAPFTEVRDPEEIRARIEAVKLMYEDGQMARTDFLQQVFEFLKYRGSISDFVGAWQGIFTENAPMVRLVRQLQPHYPLYLLSNTNCMHVEGLFRDFPWFDSFQGGTYSHLARASKPNPRIYEIACQKHGLVPDQTFFIDDLAANIATATALGFSTHHYDPDRHEALLTRLASESLLPAVSPGI